MAVRESNIVEGDLSKGVDVKIAADYFAEGYIAEPRRSSSYKKDVVTSATYRQALMMAGNNFDTRSDTQSMRMQSDVRSVGFNKSILDTHSSPTDPSAKEETKEQLQDHEEFKELKEGAKNEIEPVQIQVVNSDFD